MLIKKLLISLSILGAIGGSGAGIYYSLKKDNDQKRTEDSGLEVVPASRDEDTKHHVDSDLPAGEDARVDDNLEAAAELSRQPGIQDSEGELEVKDSVQGALGDSVQAKIITTTLTNEQTPPEPKSDSDSSASNFELTDVLKVNVPENQKLADSDTNLKDSSSGEGGLTGEQAEQQ